MKECVIRRTAAKEPFMAKLEDSMIVCRCEEITKGEIRQAVYDGMMTMNEVKRYLRTGMGLCQGQSCSRKVRDIIAEEMSVPRETIEISSARNPIRPVPMSIYANDKACKRR